MDRRRRRNVVRVLHEELQPLKLAAFGLVWLGLALFSLATYRGPDASL